MDCTPLIMPRFQPLLADVNQISYQNTVAVHNVDDSWWLGYIQDMNGDQAFIHFDAKKVTARWVHMGRVWALPFYINTGSVPEPKNFIVYAALRDEDDGPFRFRPVTKLGCLSGCEKCEVFYIKTDRASSIGQPDSPGCEMADNCQITVRLPPDGSPLLHHSGKGLQCTKYLVPFSLSRAQTLLSDASDKFRLVRHFRRAFKRIWRSQLYRHYLLDCCRFHLRTERDACIFVVMTPEMDAQMAQTTGEMITQVLKEHLASRVHLPAIGQKGRIVQRSLHETDAEPDTCSAASHLCHLPPWLFSQIFLYMDLHSQMRAKRVCALWRLLLSSPSLTKHISISLGSCAGIQCDNNNCFRLLSLLSRTITTTTESLTALEASRLHNTFFLSEVLFAMKITLPLIVFKDYEIMGLGTVGWTREEEFQHPAVVMVRYHKENCKFILLLNWSSDHLFGGAVYFVFKEDSYNAERTFLPAHEQAFMQDLTEESAYELPIDQLRITIPRLLLRCDDDKMHIASRFMYALNDNFPAVTEEMLAKVTAVYARWVRTLDYPGDWQPIRSYLLMFSPFEPDGRPKTWAKVDMRLVDVRILSRMAIYGIDALFRI
ncbi:uncharacterized protein LOC129596852 [Paramacrobiotus metropolitanus]|uniref:uncharacterized protein LOC129596852 n=1 Tax=Paramacrobiotus metropolitanus TaxID=2943436 RepID=UPI00244591CB|nr:uncharacterized protein LOC129596852 [Paramacrobiotus metropolitanus]XP_055350205.1 uncharacterized protein LOC129596852 [Paramacrobiotus metropolitanus]XP_055350206.1 uncharacterized protein LOC129596852 [Paramacrobiotus metropolitanus]XP_055350207.1 uncharacterized protein LOC129596852 [Paramacrobiotus metropolitanus]XP_055350208.1 uncharacterized protein LOC129596852 [Paramacrobiotus metropolitanus]XP_055350209.1 uncharacterized protein LOC129596852 [Paramacrobiotus metropolitanus]